MELKARSTAGFPKKYVFKIGKQMKIIPVFSVDNRGIKVEMGSQQTVRTAKQQSRCRKAAAFLFVVVTRFERSPKDG